MIGCSADPSTTVEITKQLVYAAKLLETQTPSREQARSLNKAMHLLAAAIRDLFERVEDECNGQGDSATA